MEVLKFILTHRWFQYIWIGLGILMIGMSTDVLLTKPFWGHAPLIWLLGIWLFITGILWRRITRSRESLIRFLLSTLSGLLLALAFPVSPLTPLIFTAFIPLLFLFKYYDRPSYFTFFSHLYNAFFLWNIITTYWVLNTSFAPGIFANVVNAGLMTIPWLLFKKVNNRFSFRTASWALIAFWIAFEYIHLQWEISWPWLNIGNVFAYQIEWIQWYEWTGVFGGSLWIWAVNFYLFRILSENINSRKSWIKLAVAVGFPIVLSLAMLELYEEKGTPVEVVIVQPNYEPHYEKFDVPQSEQIRKMVELASREVTDSTDFLLFPETVLHRVRLNEIYRHPGIKAFVKISEQFPDLNLISGISSFRVYPLDSLANRATRTHIDSRGDTTYWDVQNNAIWMKNGVVREMYFKSKLVPGAEIFPYREWLPFLKPIVDQLGGSLEGHAIQPEREALGEGKRKVAPVICYESVYGAYLGEYVEEGANGIFIMTNDGWWDDTPGHLQHLHFARLRAIEQRKSIARAANTGISCFIDQKGYIRQPTMYEQDAVIKGKILLNDHKTYYNRWKDYIAYAAGLFSIFFLIASLLPGFYKKI
ncbi:MAG: apolipoprotein N-acyltransferase [Saprospiraceae bacterium]|nr:apolipoprotein N-acyltransferase [Saprospiraceae bacterium]